MDVFRIRGVRIEGIAACVPQNKIDNETALRELYGDEAKLIMESTGIRVRYAAEPGTSSADLCVFSAQDVLSGTGTSPDEIGGVVFVTFTPERLMPFNASAVQQRLGLPREIPAFDLNLACSGYGYGLYIASTLVNASGKKVLLLDGDVQTAYVSPRDKSTVPVMADAGSATLLAPGSSAPEWKFSFYTDGTGREVLTIPAGGSGSPVKGEDLEYIAREDGGLRRNADIYMDGFAVFRFVASDVSKWLSKFMNVVGENSETIASFVPHQANMYMIRKLARKLKFPWERTWQSGDALGNSASATVPVTIAWDARRMLTGDIPQKVLISGFGAGLSASAGIITLDSAAYYHFEQYPGGETN